MVARAAHREFRSRYAREVSEIRLLEPGATTRAVVATIPEVHADADGRRQASQSVVRMAHHDHLTAHAQARHGLGVTLGELITVTGIEHPHWDSTLAGLRIQTSQALGLPREFILPSRYGVAILAPETPLDRLPGHLAGRPELFLTPASRARRTGETGEDYADRVVAYLVITGQLRWHGGYLEISDHLAEIGAPLGSTLRADLWSSRTAPALQGGGRADLYVDPAAMSRALVDAADQRATTDRELTEEAARVDCRDAAALLRDRLITVAVEPFDAVDAIGTAWQAHTALDAAGKLANVGLLEAGVRGVYETLRRAWHELAEFLAEERISQARGGDLAALTAELEAEIAGVRQAEVAEVASWASGLDRAETLALLVGDSAVETTELVLDVVDVVFWVGYYEELDRIAAGEVEVSWDV